MFWKFIFAANIVVLIRYVSLIPYKLNILHKLIEANSLIYDKIYLKILTSFSYLIFLFEISFMILTAAIIFEKGFRKNIFNKTLLKIIFWSFILPVILLSSIGLLYNAFISNVWQITLKDLLIFAYNIIILTGIAQLAYKKETNNELIEHEEIEE